MNREATIYDIAERLNISAATVSRGLKDHPAINKETKKRIAAVAHELGYRSNKFASNLRGQRTHTIGVIVPRLNSLFMSSVLAGIETVVNESGFNILISQSLEQQAKEKSNAITHFNNRVDGLITSLSYETEDFSHFDSFIQKKIPLVFFDRVPDTINATKIVLDNLKAGYEATKHLIGQGCRDIVHITGNLKRNVYRDRLQGYRNALEENGIPFAEHRCISNDLSEQAMADCIHNRIFNVSQLPDALFIANDSSAAFAISILKEQGYRIPQEIAIVGFNNDLISKVTEPAITTVNYPGYQMGQHAARLILNDISGQNDANVSSTVILNPELIIRKSSLKQS
ncbi:LacI family DNA-binding transcriptional regulator [Parapedobacter tibetensis]|uniref:LacI family DNA-binding transcriptional regulator n=1 Tax=Parapedobacter tibetensis TaxID=2972951 RepID=UPI00214DC3E8|nr:LacI family DNA-binding transcriptional regulator [Parapedobacter tibetensis]